MLSPLSLVQVQAAARQSRADGDDKDLGGPGKWSAAGKGLLGVLAGMGWNSAGWRNGGDAPVPSQHAANGSLPSQLKQASRASVHTSPCLAVLQSAVCQVGAKPSHAAPSLETAEPQLWAPLLLIADVKRIKTENGYAGLKEEPVGVKAEALGVRAEPAGMKAEPGGSAAAAHEELAWEDVKEDEQQQQQVLPGEAVAAEEHDDEADWEDI